MTEKSSFIGVRISAECKFLFCRFVFREEGCGPSPVNVDNV